MTDKISQARDAESDEETGHTAGRKPGEQSRTTHQDASEPASAQKAQEEQDRQLESGEENPG
jgi:hypothetical protein